MHVDDYHGSWDGKTGHNSPLYAMRNERKKFREWNINSSMHVWVELGCPKEKLNIGLSAYGWWFDFLYNDLFIRRTSFFVIWRNWNG
jgi:GH18 family chitinase